MSKTSLVLAGAIALGLGGTAQDATAAPGAAPAHPARGAPAVPPPPTVRLRLKLSKAIGHDGKAVGKVMRASRLRFQRCNRAGHSGTIKALFIIGTTGRVTWARSKGIAPAVAGCITRVIRKLSFPKPTTRARVIYRMYFGEPPAKTRRLHAGPHDGRNVRLRLRPGKLIGIDKAAVAKVLKPNIWRLRKCSKGTAKNTVKARFSIGATGSIVYWSASGDDPTLADCVATVLRGLRFPKPSDGTARVFYTFDFAPRG
jgi:hypothetical protein